MARRSAFRRDFEDLHGRGAYADVRITPVSSNAETGVRLAVGALGLFWSLILGVVLIVGTGLFGLAVWALLNPAHLGPG